MRYFFILGSNPVLSTAEIIALLPGREFTITEMYRQAVIVDALPDADLDLQALMGRLGGTVKVGTLFEGDYAIDSEVLSEQMMQGLSDRVMNVGSATYGLSIHSIEATHPARKQASLGQKFKTVGMDVKKQLKAAGCSARFVRPTSGTTLTSVQVEKNRMIRDGAEFVVLAKEDKMYIGKTEIVQAFEDFSKADFGRPERDTKQGMLPPKLARIMVNLTHVSNENTDISLLDPFCGSGTVLSEALRMGFGRLYGNDINPKAIESTNKNLEWIRANGLSMRDDYNAKLFTEDSRKLGEHIKPNTIGAVVTEPYLGPPMTGREKRGELQKHLHDVAKLYYETLRALKPLLKKDAPVVMALPVYIHGIERHTTDTSSFAELGFFAEPLLPSVISSRLGAKSTKNGGLLYGRNTQKVWREIVRFRVRD